ncbi:MAG: gamma-glutamylcyclotransferase [Acidobacteria bacterium]|nr:gamma-glutamylcyclotransferase [Acidobacteriota bacterium]MCW5969896.1 gamma-glutamylcyclotransferase [Blastocatellales bacterium]
MKGLYFGYGSNLNQEDWEERGFRAGVLQPLFSAYLPDFRLSFSLHSSGRNGGVLSVTPRRGCVVPGVVFEVQDGGWETLDRKEGNKYRRFTATVLRDGVEEVQVTTYEAKPDYEQPFVEPNPDYLAVVREGLEAHQLDIGPLLAATDKEMSRSAGEITGLFVYGTLMRGESRHHLIRQANPGCIIMAEICGKLIDFGQYPGLLLPDDREKYVQGEFCRFPSVEQLLTTLDEVEGFRGYGQSGSLYRRVLRDVGVGEGRVRQAWTYAYDSPNVDAPIITSGDWREHRGLRDEMFEKLIKAHCDGESEEAIAGKLAQSVWVQSEEDLDRSVQDLLPLKTALAMSRVSERRLAQVSQKWAAEIDRSF